VLYERVRQIHITRFPHNDFLFPMEWLLGHECTNVWELLNWQTPLLHDFIGVALGHVCKRKLLMIAKALNLWYQRNHSCIRVQNKCERIRNNFTSFALRTVIHSHNKFYSRVYE
jgi:hypothetical protein